ncbi:MAG: PGF-CTERM-anchored ABC transporter substrate-binding protein [Haloferacaceae archaeon]
MRQTAILISLLVLVAGVGVSPAAGAAPSPEVTSHGSDATYESCEFPVEMTDATGETVRLEERPERVVTIGPSAAQTMWEIGAEDQVVGVSQFAQYLDGADEKANVSAEFGASVERVVAAEPDLVLAPNVSADDVEPLREAGLTVYHFPQATDVDDVRQKTRTVGTLTGNCEGAAETNAWMDANVEAVQSVTAEAEDRPRALYPLGGGYVAAGNTFIDSVISLSGAENAAGGESGYPQLSDEVVLEMDPEVLVVNSPGAFVGQEPYASTTAGQTDSTVVVEVQWLNQPAPRSIVYATHNLTEQLHPELYDEGVYVERSEISVSEAGSGTPTDTDSETDGDTDTEPADDGDTDTEPADGTDGAVDVSTPGFGIVATVLAALFAALLAVRRSAG